MHWCTIVALLLLKVKNDHRRSHKRELFLNANFFILPPQFTYELFHIYFTPFHSLREIWTQQIDLVPNVWLHSSVGRASHRYRRGHGFESRWSPDFFRLLLSSWLNWKIYCHDHSSLWSTTAVHIWIISYILHATITFVSQLSLQQAFTNNSLTYTNITQPCSISIHVKKKMLLQTKLACWAKQWISSMLFTQQRVCKIPGKISHISLVIQKQ